MGKRSSQYIMLGKTGYSHVNNFEFDHYVIPLIKLTQNGLGQKCKTWNPKTPGRKQRKTYWHCSWKGFLLDMTSKVKITKTKINK